MGAATIVTKTTLLTMRRNMPHLPQATAMTVRRSQTSSVISRKTHNLMRELRRHPNQTRSKIVTRKSACPMKMAATEARKTRQKKHRRFRAHVVPMQKIVHPLAKSKRSPLTRKSTSSSFRTPSPSMWATTRLLVNWSRTAKSNDQIWRSIPTKTRTGSKMWRIKALSAKRKAQLRVAQVSHLSNKLYRTSQFTVGKCPGT